MPKLALSGAIREVDAQLVQAVRQRGLFGPDELEKAKRTLVGLLDSVVIVRSPKKDEQGRIQYIEVPNDPIRLASAIKLIELETGKAPQTVDVTTNRPGSSPASQGSAAEMMLANPDLAASLFGKLMEAMRDAKAAGKQELKAESVDLPPESESEGPQR